MIRSLLGLVILLSFCSKPLQAEEFEREQIVFGDVNLRLKMTADLPKKEAFQLMGKAFAIAKSYDEIFSTYRLDSEITKLNLTANKEKPQKMTKRMAAALKAAETMRIKTHGSFDAGYETPKVQRPIYKINRKNELTFLEKTGRINPTGLVKGLCVDEITKLLMGNTKVKKVVVAASGDIRVASKDGSSQEVLLENPKKKGQRKTLWLKNEAISTSGEYRRGHHLINTGKGRGGAIQVSVRAKDCLTSDTLDTALFYLHKPAMLKVLKNFPGAEVFVMGKRGGYSVINGKTASQLAESANWR